MMMKAKLIQFPSTEVNDIMRISQKTILWIGIFVLLLLNLILVNSIISSNDNNLSQNELSLPSQGDLDFIRYSLLPDTLHQSLVNPNNSFELITLFPKNDCPICTEIELPHLNSLSKKFASKINLIDIGMTYDLKSKIKGQISVQKVKNSQEKLPWLKTYMNVPIAFLIDQNGIVYLKHVNDYKNPKNTKDFYSKVETLLNLATN